MLLCTNFVISSGERRLWPDGKRLNCVSSTETGIWPDDTLLTRLESANVKFASSIPTQASPLLTILISWVLPILIFSFIGKLIMGRMTSGGAIGNAMSFGKANAKIYVEAQTGKTFADVAGADEEKEELKEVVEFLKSPDKFNTLGARIPHVAGNSQLFA